MPGHPPPTPTDTRDAAHPGTAEAIAGDALSSTGVDVLGLTVVSVEPRGSGAITGVEAELAGDAGPERRTVYVDESRSPAAVWVHPDDPQLAALAAATFPHALAVLLERVGIAGVLDRVELVAYRPGRRGVVRAALGDRTVYVKVVRPDRAEAIVDRHRMLRDAGLPVPGVLGWSPAGVIVLEAAPGTALTSAVGYVDAAEVVRRVDALRWRLASVAGLAASDRASVPSRAGWYAARLGERMPRLADRLRPLADLATTTAPDAPLVAAHGDLHAGQLFVEARTNRIAGLIDVDTVALAEAGTDVGAFLAHALASAELAAAAGDTRRAAGFRRLAEHGWTAWLGNSTDAPAVIASARRHTVGQLLAQAMHLAHTDGHERPAERLIVAAEHAAAGRRLPAAHDEDALIGTTTAAHRRAGA